jgi:hypothetical protein
MSSMTFLLIWLRPAIPLWFLLTLSHLLLLVAWVLEYAAYASLLGRRDWRTPLMLLTSLAVIAQLVLHGAEKGHFRSGAAPARREPGIDDRGHSNTPRNGHR